MPNPLAYQNEENSLGPAIACGVISIMSTAASSSGMATAAPAPPAMENPEI